MKTVAVLVVLLLLAGLLALCTPETDRLIANADEVLVIGGTVDRIIDADTIDILLDSGKARVRMQGIDAPERGQPLFEEAANVLRELVAGGEVELQPAEQTSYARMVARVYVDGTDINAEIVRRGFAMAERRFLREFEDGEDYCVFEHEARTERLGIWRLPADQRVAPWEWRDRNQRTIPFTDYGNETVEGCIAAIGKPFNQTEPLTPEEEQLPDFTCGTKNICRLMTSCAEAMFYLETCGVTSLDGNRDGVPCEADHCR